MHSRSRSKHVHSVATAPCTNQSCSAVLSSFYTIRELCTYETRLCVGAVPNGLHKAHTDKPKGVKYLKCHVVFFLLKQTQQQQHHRTEKHTENNFAAIPMRAHKAVVRSSVADAFFVVSPALSRFVVFSLFPFFAFYLCSLITTIIHRSIELKRWIKNQF